jgi:site-specific DNA-methyltransferase (adenine-specific)
MKDFIPYYEKDNCIIYNENCLDVMNYIIKENIKVDLTITSPPYDNLRNYRKSLNWNEEIWKEIIKSLYNITADGGVVVWVVGDSIIKGSETGTSFKQALFTIDCGFKLHDTMIYQKNSYPFPPINRYYSVFEYMFVFVKGKLKTANIQRCETDIRWRRKNNKSSSQRNSNGDTTKIKYECGKDNRKMDNVWKLNTGYMKGTTDKIAFEHPATFPDLLAERHILSWSNENDIIFDPMMGSGTVGKMALLNNRKFIGIEIVKEYCNIAKERIENTTKK